MEFCNGTLGIRLGLFPLWLRAPRCLGAPLLFASLKGGASVWGRKRFSPPASGLLLAVVFGVFSAVQTLSFLYVSGSLVCAYGVRPRTTPSFIFQYKVCGVAFAAGNSEKVNVGARPKSLTP